MCRIKNCVKHNLMIIFIRNFGSNHDFYCDECTFFLSYSMIQSMSRCRMMIREFLLSIFILMGSVT